MEVTINTVNDVEREMEINVPVEELQPHFDEAYKKAVPNLEIKGFRKGKVPLPMVKKLFGASIEYQTIEDLTNDLFRKESEARKINPIGTPIIVKLDFKPGLPLSFKIKYEVKPEFELKDLSGIEIEKFVHAATDEEVNKEIERLQQINAAFEEAQKVEGEDFVVTADLIDYDEQGNLLEKSKRENMRITLLDNSAENEIKEALQGVSVGDVKEVKFEHQHGDHSHKIHLQISVKKVERAILPAMDDELAKKASNGKFQTAAELCDNIKKDLEDFWKDRSARRFENDLLEAVVKQYDFTVPNAVINNLLDTYVEEVKNQQPGRILPKNFNEKKYRESYKNIASWQGKWLLIKEAMTEKENITITDADIAQTAETEAAKLGIDKERLVGYYKSSEQATERIKYDRLLDVIKRAVKVKETVTDDYSKFDVQ